MYHCTRVARTIAILTLWLLPLSLGQALAQDTSAQPAHSLQPRPALKAAEAARYRLVDIADTGERLVAVGQRGTIVYSTDGKEWLQAESPVDIMLTRVRFLDETLGWAVGYDATILHSRDGGRTWAVQHYDAEARQLYDILMLNPRQGIAVGGYGSYLVTDDGGVNWRPRQSPLADMALHFNSIEKLGDGTLFIVGEKSLMAFSLDNGESWQMLNSPYNGSFFGSVALGTRGALVYGLRGHVYVSLDVTAAARQDPARFDPPSRAMIEDPKKVAAMGWQALSGGLNESMFGATRLPDGEVMLAGVNGLAEKTQLVTGRLVPIELPTEATLSGLLPWRGRLVGVGKRGVVDLGLLN